MKTIFVTQNTEPYDKDIENFIQMLKSTSSLQGKDIVVMPVFNIKALDKAVNNPVVEYIFIKLMYYSNKIFTVITEAVDSLGDEDEVFDFFISVTESDLKKYTIPDEYDIRNIESLKLNGNRINI